VILEDYLLLSMATGFGVTWFIHLLVLLQVHRQASSLYAMVLFLSRLIVTALLGILLWQVFEMVEFEKNERPDPFKEPHRMAFVGDESISMDLPGVPGRSRRSIRDEVWNTVQLLTKDIPADELELRSYGFADRLAPADQTGGLDRRRSALAPALEQVLSDFNPEALVLCTDGAPNEPPLPQATLDLLASRGIKMVTVLPGKKNSGLFDLSADELRVPPEDPKHLKFTASIRPSWNGETPIQTEVQFLLKIDGKQALLKVHPLQEAKSLTFPIPDVLPGWHELSMEMVPQENELLKNNNRLRSAFYVSPRRRMIYGYAEDSLETREQIALLGQLYPTEISYLDLRDKEAVDKVNLEDVKVVWLMDVAPSNLPKAMLDLVKGGEADLMFWGGKHLESWLEVGVPEFPLLALEAHELAESENQWPWIERGVYARLLDAVKGFELHSRRIPRWTLSEGSWEELAVKYGESRLPLLTFSQVEGRLVGTFAYGETWRWLRSRESEEREFHSDLLTKLLKRFLFPDPLPELEVEVVMTGSDPLTARFTAKSKGPVPVQQMDQIRFELRQGDAIEVLAASLRAEVFETEGPLEWDRVYFLKALAVFQGRELFSSTQPFWKVDHEPEFMEPTLRPDLLEHPVLGDLVEMDQCKEPIEKMVKGFVSATRTLEVRKRDSTRELVLSVLLVLFLLIDWKLEKWIRERKTALKHG